MSEARADQDESRVGQGHARDTEATARTATCYDVDAETRPRGTATISARTSTLAFDGSAGTGELLPDQPISSPPHSPPAS